MMLTMKIILLKSGIMPMVRMIHLILSDEDDDDTHVHYDDDTNTHVADHMVFPFMRTTTMRDNTTTHV